MLSEELDELLLLISLPLVLSFDAATKESGLVHRARNNFNLGTFLRDGRSLGLRLRYHDNFLDHWRLDLRFRSLD
jgi:hypothetical protein